MFILVSLFATTYLILNCSIFIFILWFTQIIKISRNTSMSDKVRRLRQSSRETRWLSSVHLSPWTKKTWSSVQVNTVCTGSEPDQDSPIPASFTLRAAGEMDQRRRAASTVCPKLYRTPQMLGLTTALWSHVERSCLVKEPKWRWVRVYSCVKLVFQ